MRPLNVPESQISLASRLKEVWPCRALVVAPDQQTLYSATTRDLRALSLSDPRQPAFLDPIGRPDHYYTFAAATNERLALLEDVFLEVSGAASLLDSAGLTELQVFEPDYANSIPFGVGFMSNSLLLQAQRIRGRRRELALELFSQQPAGMVKQHEFVFHDYEAAWDESVQGFPLLNRGNVVVVAPTRQVLELGATGFAELRGSEQGGLARVLPAGVGTVAAYGSTSSHLVDISEPSKPKLVAGGLLPIGSAGPLQVALHGAEASPSWLNLPAAFDPAPRAPAQATVTLLQQVGRAAPAVVGSAKISGGAAERTMSAGLLFELRSADTAYSLRSYALPTDPVQAETLGPLNEQVLDSEGITWLRLGLDVSSNVLVLAGTAVDDNRFVRVRLFQRSGQDWLPVVATTLPTEFIGTNTVDFVAVDRGAAVIVSERGRRIDRLALENGALNSLGSRDLGAELMMEPFEDRWIKGILGFERERLYVSSAFADDVAVAPRVLALDLTTLETVAEYELPDDVASMTQHEGKLIFGMASQLSVAAPACY
jgi:hypothetical protein